MCRALQRSPWILSPKLRERERSSVLPFVRRSSAASLRSRSPSYLLVRSFFSSTTALPTLPRTKMEKVDSADDRWHREGPCRLLGPSSSWQRTNQPRACESCRKRRIRCSSFETGAPCSSCTSLSFAPRSSAAAPAPLIAPSLSPCRQEAWTLVQDRRGVV